MPDRTERYRQLLAILAAVIDAAQDYLDRPDVASLSVGADVDQALADANTLASRFGISAERAVARAQSHPQQRDEV